MKACITNPLIYNCVLRILITFQLILLGTLGIGKATTQELVRRGAVFIRACRQIHRAQKAIEDIRKETGAGELVS